MRRKPEVPQQFKKFLAIGENKIDLVNFFRKDRNQEVKHKVNIPAKEIHITVQRHTYRTEARHGNLCCYYFRAGCSPLEEPDTTMFLAAQYTCTVCESDVTFFTVDSDVVTLGCYFANKIPIYIYL